MAISFSASMTRRAVFSPGSLRLRRELWRFSLLANSYAPTPSAPPSVIFVESTFQHGDSGGPVKTGAPNQRPHLVASTIALAITLVAIVAGVYYCDSIEQRFVH